MGTPSLRPSSLRLLLVETLTLISPLSRKTFSSPPPLIRRNSLRPRLSMAPAGAAGGTQCAAYGTVGSPAPSLVKSSPISDAYCTTNLDAEEALMGLITGKWNATEVAHSVWKYVIRKGDTVVDATCGNGHDTLALLKMVADESCMGRVYGMDIQNSALESTSSLLENSVDKDERKLVKLFSLCHSKMEDVVPKDIPVRLIAFNLGYLPGGDKGIITESQTTLMALQAASRLLMSGGLISMVIYVGHPGGRDELVTVQSFASSLPAETWVSCKLETLNRPTGPILVLLYKK